jgi:hypothetical protein
MSDALTDLQHQADLLAALDAENSAGTAPAFERYMAIKYQGGEDLKMLLPEEHPAALPLWQTIFTAEQRYNTVR